MAAGLGFKDFVTGEVLTAADVDGYLMQNIWVFASTAARDAAVTAPAEGNFAFTKDTDSLWYYNGAAWVASGATGDIEGVTAGVGISGGGTSGTVTVTNSMATAITTAGDTLYGTGSGTFSRLGIGTAGQVLKVNSGATAPEWGAAATGGSLTLLSTTTFSGASVDLTSISGSYKHLYLQWYGLTNATANAYLDMRLNNNSGSVYNIYRAIGAGATSGAQAEGSATYMRVVNDNLDRTSANNAGNMFIYNYTSATNYKLVTTQFGFRAPSTNNIIQTNCLFLSNTAVTQVNFFLDNGASFSSGTVELYGVN